MIWWLAGGLAVVLLVVIVVRAVGGGDRASTSWWAARNGFRYTAGTRRLFGHLPGAPFDRGTSQDPHDVLSGEIAGRPALIMRFSWFRLPTGGGPDGLHSGICSVAVLELPAAVPELFVREETAADRARGRDLQLESERFNDTFRISGAHDRFTYDVLNPRVMEWLLDRPGFRFRLGGRTLAVWRDGATDLAELRDFAATLFGMIPGFVYSAGYPAAESPLISAIPAADLGRAPTGTLHMMQHLTHRGHDIERYEHERELWGVAETAVSVKIAVPTVWPVLMIAAKKIVAGRGRQPRFDDGVVSGQADFDELYACGTPRPGFALTVLHKEFTDLLVERHDTGSVCVVLQSERLPVDDGDGPDWLMSGGIWVTAAGELADQALADRLTELACDLMAALPPAALDYHVGAPEAPPAGGTWGNELPGYFVSDHHV